MSSEMRLETDHMAKSSTLFLDKDTLIGSNGKRATCSISHDRAAKVSKVEKNQNTSDMCSLHSLSKTPCAMPVT